MTRAGLDPAELATFTGRRVLVLGDVILDRYIKGSVDRISPEAPVPVVRVRGQENRPGGAANVAANVASCGAVPELLAVVGDDEAAGLIAAELRARGIAPEGLVPVPGRPTTVKTRVIAHHQQVVRLDAEDDRPVPAAALAQVTAAALAALERSHALIVSDYAKGLLGPAVLGPVLAAARARALPVVVDPKRRDFALYAPATVLTPNLGEAARAAGIDSVEPTEIATALVERLDVDAVLVTLGEAGMLLRPRRGPWVPIRAEAREVFDVTGAGDTVAAVLGVALAAGLPLERAARWANAAAAVSVGRLGTAAVTRAELEEFTRGAG